MGLVIEAVFENGVFVPTQPPGLAEHDRVRLLVEPIGEGRPSRQEIVRRRLGNKLKIDSQLGDEIARSPDFLPEEA